MASIRTAGLTKDFGDLRAVNEIDLDLPEGGVAGFVGPNGAGKSTTIRMLLGLITPTGGEGEVLGHPIDRPATYLHAESGELRELANQVNVRKSNQVNIGGISRLLLGARVTLFPHETTRCGGGESSDPYGW